jgi:hypothetical protein
MARIGLSRPQNLSWGTHVQKLIASLISAFLMVAGLVAFTQSSATAACPYTGCVGTYTRIKAPDTVKRGDRLNFRVNVTTAGNGEPKGRVTIRVVRSDGDYRFTDSKKFTGDAVKFTTTQLPKRGKYIIRAVFDRKAGSGFRDSDNTEAFRVVRR